ncbi:hypothetical protein BYT27DRAFT_7182183 [Phlegmacium glaucopus]|nr:hypothetical protein BYT27DRAFT_7182183 [Phlegmacium glaucopus]
MADKFQMKLGRGTEKNSSFIFPSADRASSEIDSIFVSGTNKCSTAPTLPPCLIFHPPSPTHLSLATAPPVFDHGLILGITQLRHRPTTQIWRKLGFHLSPRIFPEYHLPTVIPGDTHSSVSLISREMNQFGSVDTLGEWYCAPLNARTINQTSQFEAVHMDSFGGYNQLSSAANLAQPCHPSYIKSDWRCFCCPPIQV